jgi:hypothetical protein
MKAMNQARHHKIFTRESCDCTLGATQQILLVSEIFISTPKLIDFFFLSCNPERKLPQKGRSLC